MDKKKAIKDQDSFDLFHKIKKLHSELDHGYLNFHNRSLPLNEELSDRWERAKKLGFGDNSSIYDSSLVFGDIIVGESCWIGPFTIVDGSGGLKIGKYCTISAGVQIYSHDNIKQTLSSKRFPIERNSVVIGDNVYIGPNSVITRGVSIGSNCIVGAFSFVNKDIPNNSIVFGQPAKVKGSVKISDEDIELIYK